MSYTIYGDKGSGAFSAEAVLAEAGAPYQFHSVSLKDDEQRRPEFLAINPSGKMPALRLPEGDVITESSAILLTVADHFPNAHLLPSTGPARAQAYRWLAFMASEIYPMVEVSDYPERFAPTGEQAEALRLKARERIRERLLIVERFILFQARRAVAITAATSSRVSPPRVPSRQIRFTASRTPVSGRTVMDMVGIGKELGPNSKRKRARRVARMMCACIIAKFAPTQTRGPAPNGR